MRITKKVSLIFIFFKGRAQTFKAGVATRVITPKPLLPVSGGVGASHPVIAKKGELYAHALVFEKGETRVALPNIGYYIKRHMKTDQPFYLVLPMTHMDTYWIKSIIIVSKDMIT